jgi:hypothetical protein
VPDTPNRRSRLTLGALLAIVAMLAANISLVVQVGRLGGWGLAAMIVGTNAVFCLMAGAVVRFRLIPLMALFTTAALTEALLFQAATSRRPSGWIATAAVMGAVALLALAVGVRALQRPRSRGHQDEDGLR